MKKKNLLLALSVCAGFITNAYAQAPPVANFSGTPTTICAGKSVTWTNLTTGGAFMMHGYFPEQQIPLQRLQIPDPEPIIRPAHTLLR